MQTKFFKKFGSYLVTLINLPLTATNHMQSSVWRAVIGTVFVYNNNNNIARLFPSLRRISHA